MTYGHWTQRAQNGVRNQDFERKRREDFEKKQQDEASREDCSELAIAECCKGCSSIFELQHASITFVWAGCPICSSLCLKSIT